WMCRAAKIATWDNVTVAQDLTDEAVAECRWVDRYIVEDVMTSEAISAMEPFDVISLTHVYEHLAHPIGMLERLGSLLSDRGFIFITAPHRPYGWKPGDGLAGFDGWSYNHVPAHLQYFNRDAFRRAAEHAGLDVALFEDHHEGGQAFEGWLRRPPGPRA
ncbi:MAG: methyltransferase domain-containing protein, partial [Acidobacteriota bacterium]